MDAQALNGYIRQEIRKEVYNDRIELYLPFFFGNDNNDPLCLVWNDKGILSDRGRTLTELKKRVGDLTPYKDSIQKILDVHGLVTLEGGQNLVIRHFQTYIFGEQEYKGYLAGLNRLIRVISLISVLDTIQVNEDGSVSLC